MNNNFDVNEIVKVEQMPKVFSQLEKIGAFIDEQTKDLDKLECTEENKQEVKNRRTEINNALKILEDKRIEIKNQLLEPYNIFNSKYEEECKVKLEEASELLKEKIDFIENGQRKVKEDELRVFFEQYQKDYHLEDLVKFEDAKLNITITASMKSLKDTIVDFLTTIRNDIEIISNEEDSDELLLEYKNNGFDYQRAKLNLIERKKQLEALKQKQEIVEKIETEEAKVEEKAIEITAPKEIIEEDEELEVTFTLKGSKNKILQVKKLIEELGIEYE
jgi:hypothetical protein